MFCENGRAVLDGFAKGCNDGGYDVPDVLGGTPAGGYADDVAFDEGVIGVCDEVGLCGCKVLGRFVSL